MSFCLNVPGKCEDHIALSSKDFWLATVILNKKIKKQRDVSSDVLVTAIDVKCIFTYRINAKQGKMLNIVNELLEGGLETINFKCLFLKNQAVRPVLKFWELVNNMRTKPSTFFEKDLPDSFSVIIKVVKNRRFCHL